MKIGAIIVLVLLLGSAGLWFYPSLKYQSASATPTSSSLLAKLAPAAPPVTHLPTPKPLKAIYMTNWVAGTHDWRASLVKLINETEINAVVIDIKDYSGAPVTDRVKDLPAFITELHQNNIYVIGRVASFQDAAAVKTHPTWAVKRASDGGIWRDRKGIPWIDPGTKDYWDYLIAIAKTSHDQGFDEINFDYIRFPSDGNMQDISYPSSGTTTRAVVLENFFSYLHSQLKPTGLVISADLFGLSTVNHDDLGIGQVLERALPYFDYVDPMVYPSHYAPGFQGFKNPADHPYDVVNYSLTEAVKRADLLASTTGTSTTGMVAKLRPWLQNFNLGAVYTPAMIQAQIKATYDAGLTSWLLWDPANHYTPAALIKE